MRTLLRSTVLLGVAAAACASSPATKSSTDPRVTTGLAQLRAATNAFHSLDAAVAAGYPRTVADCFVHEHHGAMGYHHVNRAYVDDKVDVAHPEILLYQRMPDGAYRLNGVEFIVPYRAWPRDSVPPVLMGMNMKREDNLKIWYTHVWVWSNNKDGMFADFNPDVTCPDKDSKVFKPYVQSDD